MLPRGGIANNFFSAKTFDAMDADTINQPDRSKNIGEMTPTTIQEEAKKLLTRPPKKRISFISVHMAEKVLSDNHTESSRPEVNQATESTSIDLDPFTYYPGEPRSDNESDYKLEEEDDSNDDDDYFDEPVAWSPGLCSSDNEADHSGDDDDPPLQPTKKRKRVQKAKARRKKHKR